MISLDLLVPFILVSMLLALSPGPDNLFVLVQSALHGTASGVVITLGLCSGLLVHTAAVAFGVAALVQSSAWAFFVLKLLGALYLLFLAWQAWRSEARPLNMSARALPAYWALYRRGILMNVSNPKVSIFFLAFLPQFASLERGSIMSQIVILGAVFLLTALVIFTMIATLAGFFSALMARSTQLQMVLNKLSAGVFVVLAFKLALAQR